MTQGKNIEYPVRIALIINDLFVLSVKHYTTQGTQNLIIDDAIQMLIH